MAIGVRTVAQRPRNSPIRRSFDRNIYSNLPVAPNEVSYSTIPFDVYTP